MDLRAYYKKVREAEAELAGEHVVIVSFATSEGGKDGVPTEVPRAIAARLIAEGRGRAGTADEAAAFRDAMREAREKHEREEAARRMQVMVIPSYEMHPRPGPDLRRKSGANHGFVCRWTGFDDRRSERSGFGCSRSIAEQFSQPDNEAAPRYLRNPVGSGVVADQATSDDCPDMGAIAQDRSTCGDAGAATLGDDAALELVYRDVYFTQVVDRYEAKWQGYVELARVARETYLEGGLAGVNNPLRRPIPPVLTTQPAAQTGGTFYASVAWVNAAGQEGAASAASSTSVGNGNVMVVSANNAPTNAVGYRVYAGAALNGMFLQNSVLLPVGNTFQYLPGQVTTGTLPGVGQKPDFVIPVARTLLRG